MANEITITRQHCISVIQGTLDDELPKIINQDPRLSHFIESFRTVITQAVTIAQTAQSDRQALPYIHKIVKLGRDLLRFEFKYYEAGSGAELHDKAFKDVVFMFSSLEIELAKEVQAFSCLVEMTTP